MPVPTRSDIEAGFIVNRGRAASPQEIGVSVYHVDAGTGYHVREGAMAVYGSGISGGRQPTGASGGPRQGIPEWNWPGFSRCSARENRRVKPEEIMGLSH